ncbi:MAG: hypothetical protein HYU64_07130 [Armatimonadetes bacterium]|nr:hypothetical protein [Armatimonadota bacterium]
MTLAVGRMLDYARNSVTDKPAAASPQPEVAVTQPAPQQDSTALSPLARKDAETVPQSEGFPWTRVQDQMEALKRNPNFVENLGKGREALLDDSIPEDARRQIADALRSIPGEHLASLNQDNIGIKMEKDGTEYAHYRKNDSSIYLSPQLINDLLDPSKSRDAEAAIRHEIGHAVLDSYALRPASSQGSFRQYLDRDSDTHHRGFSDDLSRREKGERKVNDSLEENLADVYSFFFSPYQEDRIKLDQEDARHFSNDPYQVRLDEGNIGASMLWMGSLSWAFFQNPIAPLPGDLSQDPYYRQTVLDDDPWGHWR